MTRPGNLERAQITNAQIRLKEKVSQPSQSRIQKSLNNARKLAQQWQMTPNQIAQCIRKANNNDRQL